MCGIAGALGADPQDVRTAVEAMCDQMIARGPDDGGIATLDVAGAHLAIGNRRLAIIDPTPSGHQPMRDERGNVIVFNGMIYNYRELRAELISAGERFSSDCDTEVVLRAYGRWGEGAVPRLRGMFAFAISDADTGGLFLARDRFGIKPLYYWQANGRFLFASQVRALLETGRVPFRLSGEAVASFLSFGAVSEPLTAIEGVLALPAAHTGRLRHGALTVRRYWSAPTAATPTCTPADAAGELRARLEDSVSRHLVSAAPLGVFLSGGVDSSILAALAARRDGGVRTLSVVFDDPNFSEQAHMDEVARHIGSEHVRVRLGEPDLIDDLPGAFAAMDQPTFDGINTYIVSQAAAASGLKVALSGLGADELFDGYGYARRMAMLERGRRLPAALRPLALRAGQLIGTGASQAKLAAWMQGTGGASSYELLRGLFLPNEVAALMGGGAGAPSMAAVDGRGDIAMQAATLDLTHYTKNVLLRDADAMGMAHSLEVRVPYLDHELAEWVLSLPAAVRARRGKALLAEATRDLLPGSIFERRKQGFVLPIGQWLQGGLRGDASDVLSSIPAALAEHLDAGAVAAAWRSYDDSGERWLRPWALYALCRWTESVAQVARAVPVARKGVAA